MISLCVEAGRRGITVDSVAPGWVDTEMSAITYEADGLEGKKRIEATIPVGRVAAPEEIAGPIVFLCSELAASINGEMLNVNGGECVVWVRGRRGSPSERALSRLHLVRQLPTRALSSVLP